MSDQTDELVQFRNEWKKELKVSPKSAHGVEISKEKISANQEEKLITDNDSTNSGCRKSLLDCSDHIVKSSKQDVKSSLSKDLILLDLPNPETKHNINTAVKKQKLDHKAEDENLVDLLIADINEITVIPFFDLQLPREIGLRIFQFLSIKDLCHCASVSKSWRNLADDELLWFNFALLLGFVPENTLVSDKSDWKSFVHEGVIKQRQLDGRWKERICRVDAMEYERGGNILCTVSLSDGLLCAGYSSGGILLWDMQGHLGPTYRVLNNDSNNTQQETYPTSSAVTDTFCAAGLNDGSVNIWHNTLSTSPLYRYQLEGPVKSIAIARSSEPIVAAASDHEIRIDVTDDIGQWFCLKQKNFEGKIQHMKILPSSKRSVRPCVVLTTRETLHIHGTYPQDDIVVMDHMIGGKMTCIDGGDDILAVGVGPYGYGVLGNTVRVYRPDTGRLLSVLSGHYNEITCLNVHDSPPGHLITGSYDKHVRIYDLRTEDIALTLRGHESYVTAVQMDDWKVVSGAHNGEVCVWDQRTSAVLWRTHARHPVSLCHFDGFRMITANIPIDRTPQPNLWYADDLVLHRKSRGSLRLYDFSSDNLTEGLPGICSSSYDDTSGYNYNIALVTPYDEIRQ